MKSLLPEDYRIELDRSKPMTLITFDTGQNKPVAVLEPVHPPQVAVESSAKSYAEREAKMCSKSTTFVIKLDNRVSSQSLSVKI